MITNLLFQTLTKRRLALFIIPGIIFFSHYVAAVHAQSQNSSSNDAQVAPRGKPLDYYHQLVSAKQLFSNRQYTQAVELLQPLVEANPADGNNWLMLATSYYNLKQYQEAITPYIKAVDLGFLDTAQGAYQIARCYAQLGDKDASLQWLEKALSNRYRYKPRITKDEQLAAIRHDPRLRAIINQADLSLMDRTKGWLSDLDYLIAEVKRVHYRYSKEPLPAEFLRLTGETRKAISSLSDPEIVVKFQRLLALLGDGHTLVYPFGMRLGTLKRLPLTFYLFSDGLYVIDAPDELNGLIGNKIIKFGAVDAQTLLTRLEQVVSRDNPMGIKWSGPVYLTFTDYLKELGATDSLESVTLQVEDKQNNPPNQVTIKSIPINPNELNDYALKVHRFVPRLKVPCYSRIKFP